MLKLLLGILVIFCFSCSPTKRATWHVKRALELNPKLLVEKSDTVREYIDTIIYRDITVNIPGRDTIRSNDTIKTDRVFVRPFMYKDTCYAEVVELPFQYRWIDTFRWKDTTITTINSSNIICPPCEKPFIWIYIACVLVGVGLGLYIKK
jgi:hypothetical protein